MGKRQGSGSDFVLSFGCGVKN